MRRGLFGYSRKSVTAVVNEREVAITKASREATEAEERAAKLLSAELDQNRTEIDGLRARNRDLASKLRTRRSGSETSSAPARRRRRKG